MAALRDEVTEDGHILLDELVAELGLRLWPDEVFACAVDVFGPQLNNPKSRTRLSLDRKIGHAIRVWQERYGPLNADQERYVSSVLCNAIRTGAEDRAAAAPGSSLIPFVLARIGRVLNHEVVHAGFKRRATPRITVHLGDALAGIEAA